MSFGFGFSLPAYYGALRVGGAWSPSVLFANGEPGVWYDPSDMTTLFQDAAGTTPVTAVEQPVGLMLDKSKGLVLGSELVTNGDFSNGMTGWNDSNVIANGGTVAVVGGAAVITRGTARAEYYQTVATAIGKTYQFYGTVKEKTGTANWWVGTTRNNASNLNLSSVPVGTQQGVFTATATTTYITMVADGVAGQTVTIDNISVRELPGNHAYQTTTTSRPVLSARVNQYLATETLATQNVTTLAAQYRLSFEGAGTITLSGTATGVYSAGSHLITCTAGTLTSTVSGSVTKADLRVANTGAGLPAYQRINTATDYDADPAKFPAYLRFDGSDDWLVTDTITPGIDKVQVFAGVRKLSDAATGIIAEFSISFAGNAGSFFIFSGNNFGSGGAVYAAGSRGSQTQSANTPANYPSPITNILSGLNNISGDSVILRVNGAQVAQSTGDQGTGNFLAYPLYIGRRGGTTLPFNGHLYSLIVRFGANLPTATIENTENYINTKTRAF